MKFLCVFILLIALSLQRQPTPKEEKTLLVTDYFSTTESYQTINNIKTDYENYREKIKKNVTIDYQKCIDSINVLKCNNLDQWQSVIEELKLENENSQNIEIPFLQQRKLNKQMRLKVLLETSDAYDQEIIAIVGKLGIEHQAVLQAAKEVEIMYRLPKQIPEQTGLAQQLVNVPASLNINGSLLYFNKFKLVPDVAGTELNKAQTQYDVADQSIQAQTVMNEMLSAAKKIQDSMDDVQKAFQAKQKEMLEEKQQVKDDIIRLRALITNEQAIQAKNNDKIKELEGKISACQEKPGNIEKDCEPIKMRAAKLNTEIDIMNARTNLLEKQISILMEQNQTPEQIKAFNDGVGKAAQVASDRSAEMEYVTGETVYVAPEDPKERKPINHLKEGLEMHEAGKAPKQ